MPTLQAVDLEQFQSVADASGAQSSHAHELASHESAAGGARRLRGYLALGAFFLIAGSGYAGLLILFDNLVKILNAQSG